jgi:hypothetical protein
MRMHRASRAALRFPKKKDERFLKIWTRAAWAGDPSWFVEAAEIMRTTHMAHKDDNDSIQPGTANGYGART